MNTVVTMNELEMLKAAMIDYKMNYLQLEIKYGILYRKTIEIAKSFNEYVIEHPKEEFTSDDEYDSDDESDDSDDDMTPFKDNLKPDDWYPKNDDEAEILDVFDLH